MNNDHLDLKAVALVISAANAANEGAKCANQAINSITPIQFIPCLKKGDARANTNQDQVKEHITKIQAKKNSIFPDAPNHPQIPFGIMATQSVIHQIWAHAAKLVLCALAMHIALTQPHCVVRDDMVQLITAILENNIVIEDKEELNNFIKYKLKYTTPTINDLSGNSIIDGLQAILKSTHVAIDIIDAGYLAIDDVFIQQDATDHLAYLYNQTFTAFITANNTNHLFQNAWNPIMQLTDYCMLDALQQPLDATIKAKDAAKKAKKAYQAFHKYFHQLKSAIDTMVNGCTAWSTRIIQQKINSCDRCVNVAAPTPDDKTVPLGVDLKAIQEVVDKLNEAIMASYKDIEQHAKKLDPAILESDTTAKLYNTCYKQYKSIVNAIHIVSIHAQPHQTNQIG